MKNTNNRRHKKRKIMTHHNPFIKGLTFTALMLLGGVASAQVVIEGNVYGGGNIGQVSANTTVTVNDGTVGKKLTLEERKYDKDVQIMRVDNGNVYGGGNGYEITGTNPDGSPIFDANAGRVQGNTTVTVQGDAVVRRAVYGGGNIATVGQCTVGTDGVATYTDNTGQTTVTITGNALIGPKKDDLIKDDAGNALDAAVIDTNFKYLGGNEGWVFGSSRGISGDGLHHLSFANNTNVTVNGNAQVMNVFGSGENGHVQNATKVTIGGNAIIGGVPLHGTSTPAAYTVDGGAYDGVELHLKATEGELIEDKYGVGREITRGNVFGGGKGSDFISWFANPKYCYTSGRVYGNTHVTIEENAKIYNRVFGGGLIAMVGTFVEETSDDDDNHTIIGIASGGHTYVNINGGTIGSYSATAGLTGLNNGDVYGGGRGLPGRPRKPGTGPHGLEPLTPLHQVVDEAYVGHTHVTVTDGTIYNSVYGGGANGHVQGNTYVTINGGTIGHDLGGWHGNVFAGGGGTARYTEGNAKKFSITAGRVFGNTNLNITGGTIKHNVYGGGALASVGTYLKYNGVERAYFGGGKATLNITGGTIGTNGDNNGMVFGSGRGEIMAPDQIMDTLTYMAYTFVNIGKNNNGSYEGDAQIKGSVYGSGENGHVYLESQVNVYSGTIGIAAEDYDPENPDPHFAYRGNVYGAGCGTDMYDTNNDGDGDTYNPNSGYVWGQTEVNIYGGYISRSVYGGGAMGSVGLINHAQTVKHKYEDHEEEPSLSWPYELTYSKITDSLNHVYPSEEGVLTGKATVNVFGGHIGTLAAPIAECGNVFGSARGDVGPLGVMDTLAIVRETEVNVNFTPPTGEITDATPNVIIGSVYGSGENGTVYENTKVTLTNGLVRGSVFGGGDGTDTYMVALKDPEDSTGETYLGPSPQRSITSGKVYGNTEVVISGGQVLHNVYGGGNLASVGKGNYMGYGEMSASSITPSPTPYENSGTCTVTINGGTIGTNGLPDANGVVNGFVFGSSKGTTFVNISNTPRYDYSRDFFLGYANATEVTIGPATETGSPRIWGSVFGGGDNGHVRWHTDVTVNKGEIGVAYVAPGTFPDADSTNKWVYRGNVYGAGRGVGRIAGTGNYCPAAGSVTLNTNVTVNGGTIHRNVYGGGSNATVGPPPTTTGYNPGLSKNTVSINGGTIGEELTDGTLYGGDIFGASRGARDLLATNNINILANSSSTEVSINSGALVIGDVHGGGELGQVKLNTLVNVTGGTTEGSVYGGGKGDLSDEKAALVMGNATVDMTGGLVERSVYGGGELGSVGTFTYNTVTYPDTDPNENGGKTVQYPTACTDGTGLTTVTMSGGSIGLKGSLMPWEDHNPDDDDRGWIFCGGRGEADSISYPKAIAMGVVGSTYLRISNPTSGTAPLVTASVYGGSENGLVTGNTHVVIAGGQIGTGFISKTNVGGVLVGTFDEPYSETLWENAIAAVQSGNETTINDIAAQFHECDAWEYGKVEGNETKYYVYDIYAEANGHPNNNPDDPDYQTADLQGTNGHSFFGNVFGGGSGYYPIRPGIWRRTAGQVNGDTHVEITGGHILTNIYGGNETTDVKGKCTIEMSGGTLGVPRTIAQIQGHPVTCYLFGAGMGDTRTQFNKWTHVDEVEVSITGGTIFGSIFGGGEDGHVLGDVAVNVGQAENKTTLIGTWGRSYVDGNVFGGGRGFSGHALTAGVVTGNVELNITGGTMLGSIYGGGRLASVGTYLVAPENANYGKMINDNGNSEKHGHITVNIGGTGQTADITIGNDYESKLHYYDRTTGGNVFAGGMGRIDNLDPTTGHNPKWHLAGRVKNTTLTIGEASGKKTIIKGNVYGGGELGTVGGELGTPDNQNTSITIDGGTIWRDVYGGGYGSDDITKKATISNSPLVQVTPMQMAARVFGNSQVNVNGGWVKKSIYGGGEFANVGRITDSVRHVQTDDPTSPNDQVHPFYISWPYKFIYADGTGTATINVNGGRIGITGKDFMGPWNNEDKPYDPSTGQLLTSETIKEQCRDNGDIFGGGMGKAGDKYLVAHMGNVKETVVNIYYAENTATPINYKPTTTDHPTLSSKYMTGFYPDWAAWTTSAGGGAMGCITGSVYGGAEDGHVNTDTRVTLTKGLIGHSIYGGGKGKGKFEAQVYDPSTSGYVTKQIYGINTGKVYGNTHVTVNATYNTHAYVVRSIYGGGNLGSVGVGNYVGDSYYTTGYGEVLAQGDSHWADTTGTGHSYVTITGGTLGMLPTTSDPESAMKDKIPYGSVFGGCRGMATPEVEPNQINYLYESRPDVFLSYVNNTHVKIGKSGTENGSTDGPRLYGSVFGGAQDGHIRWDANVTVNKGEIGANYGADDVGSSDITSIYWAYRGNVFGGGSGIGLIDENTPESYSSVAGSVTQKTRVRINGGTIHNNVYGGGNLATVGPPTFGETDCPINLTIAKIDIVGGNIGLNNTTSEYGGRVYGSSKGMKSNTSKFANFALCPYTVVNVRDSISGRAIVSSPVIYNAVYGGGEYGQVGLVDAKQPKIHNTKVNIDGGTIKKGVYGGGQGAYSSTYDDRVSGKIMGSTEVNLMGGTIGVSDGNYAATIFGGSRSAFIADNTHVKVGKQTGTDTYEGNITIYGSIFGANDQAGTPYGNARVDVYKTAHNLSNVYPTIPGDFHTATDTLNWLASLPHGKENFAIYQVFGGSNRADYTPDSGKKATVNVYQCQENTICDVYGGSNAAHIGSTTAGYETDANVIIDGGRFYRIFGGGNGEVRASNIHGTANTDVNGGLINQVFGGSNNDGVIDEINLNINYGGSCLLYINDVFSGGNAALVLGDVVTTVECCNASYGNFYGGTHLANIYGNVTVNIFGATFNNLFAGSMGQLADNTTVPPTLAIPADIKRFPSSIPDPLPQPGDVGYNEELDRVYRYMQAQLDGGNDLRGKGGNVTLNIFGGKINEAAFGGSDVNGNIEGKIQVNVFNAGGTCDLDLNNLYGASRNTPYEPNYALGAGETERISPEINIIHGTVKGNVFGGGKGDLATVDASPKINFGYDAATVVVGVDYNPTTMGPPDTDRTLVNTLFDTIQAHNNNTWVAPAVDNYTALVKKDVYGGGQLAAVTGNTYVNMFRGTVGTDGKSGTDGNLFGGGQGQAGSLTAGRVEGNTTVEMRNGTVKGNIYGGGRLGLTGVNANGVMQDGTGHGYAKVMVKGGTVGNKDEIEEFTDFSMGNIYGGGKGFLEDNTGTHSAEEILLSGLTKNTEVEISDLLSNNTHVYGIVLGGGELASVGKYTLTKDGSGNITNIAVTEGLSKVTISGGTIGGDRTLMRPDTDATGSPWLKYNDDLGYVYGGGEGYSANPSDYTTVQESATSSMSLLDLIATVQSTEVEVSGGWVKASVFGGSESGHVRGDTKVTISGGTIGAGNNTTDDKDEYYDDDDFNNPTLNSLYGTAHWPYASPYTPFDPELLSQGITPKDGRSWFGNVFGGGSGWFPYVVNEGTELAPVWKSYWNANSGKVWGNTEVNIEGGHILNNVYGANESTDVGGKATVKISGGTIGVPRDATEIALHPTSSNVFGGGAGDPRAIFNSITNVASTDVQITGGTIYGSVFGGAEEGHVLGNAEVSINEDDGATVIGSTGFSAYDGHVFGGGKGKINKELDNTWNSACGRVAGNTHITMEAGKVLGNLYGGGFVALTGVDADGSYVSYMLTDPVVHFDSINHGMTQIDLSGGTIGNNVNSGLDLLRSTQRSGNVYGGGRGSVNEFRYDNLGRATKAVVNISDSPTIYGSVFGGGQMANVGYWIGYETGWYAKGTGLTEVTITGSPNIGTAKEFDSGYATGTPSPTNTEYELINGLRRISHTLTGNVYGGGQGNAKVDANDFAVGTEQGHSRSTRVNISGTPVILSSVFGGAEQGAVWGDTKVTISGGTIGKTGVVSHRLNGSTWESEGTYSFGSVFGGSRGEDGYKFLNSGGTNMNAVDSITRLAGRVYFNTYVDITGGTVYGNVFGGGDLASVGYWIDKKDEYDNLIDFVPAQYPNTTVGIKGKATVNISGTAKIGPMDGTGQNAYVYGGGKGIGEDPIPYRYNKYSNINSTEVTVNLTYENPNDDNPEAGWATTDGRIYGSIYGGGSDCHVLGNTKVVLNGGIIGTYDSGGNTITDYGGNIFGGGRNFLKKNYAPGRVAGNPEVEMNGGYIYGAIFGGGRHATVGTGIDGMTMRANDATGDHGKTTVKVKGGTVGYKPLVSTFTSRPIGEVYGAGKGTMVGITGHPAASPLLIALVKNTEVEISQTSSSVPTRILNSVYGGGEVGNVGHYSWTVNGGNIEDIQLISDGETEVTVKGGTIGLDRMEMSYQLVGGSDPATRYNPATNPTGNVFGGGKGLSVDPTTYAVGIDCIIDGRDYSKYLLDLMATVGSTTVTVEDQSTTVKPWVKGSVYGGSSCGHVLHDTEVLIAGGQIGAGDSSTADIDPYGDDQFVDASTTTINDGNALKPTNHWEYDANTLYPFDLVAIYNGIDYSSGHTGAYPADYGYKPTDGKTWYGNVFGGGSGFLPYIKETSPGNYECIWNRESGKVYGNSTVTITGGHILSCVYGGCETADVGLYQTNSTIHGEEWLSGGTATVTMSGGTVGVPRTSNEIVGHPVPGYVYGSGKGDARIYFNTWTNVNETQVTVTGGKIYGSIFGGGEDGHVLGNSNVSVSEDATDNPTIIGSGGLSTFDGNVFGAGRGTTAEALTAGSVSGNVTVAVSGGTVLNSVFGGGNRGSVGTYLVDKFLPDGTTPNSDYYGKMREGNAYGFVTVNVSGGTIGNSTVTPERNDPSTSMDGNVYGGGRGIFRVWSGIGPKPIWPSAARVKQTTVTISDTADVKNSVYGGGQIGTVRNNATVNVTGGTIGKPYGTLGNADYYHFGSVFGGGRGIDDAYSFNYENDSTMHAGYLAGHVYGNTFVNISGGHIYEDVYGGGEVASVGQYTITYNTPDDVSSGVSNIEAKAQGKATVNMTGGIVGPLDGTGLNGYVFGGPKGGTNANMKPYCNVIKTEVTVNYEDNDSNRVWGSLFGGGSQGHVLGDASVKLTKGTIGTNGTTSWDGNIFGGGRNYNILGLTAGRVGGNITVTMEGGALKGNIYGGGRQGLTGVDVNGDAYTTNTDAHGNITVLVKGGTVGTTAQNASTGHVFGGGKGRANSTTTPLDYTRLGEVRSTNVTITGTATVNGSVYGGSENGWVLENSTATVDESATIGYEATDFQGYVFGGGRGVDGDENTDTPGAYVVTAGRVFGQSRANINGGTVKHHVFGGGYKGIVKGERIVNINGGTVENDVYGGSNVVPDKDASTTPPTLYDDHGNLKTVNVRGGIIKGDVYGSSRSSDEGTGAANWSSFVNITGGTIGDPADPSSTGNVYGAGYEGEVNGSVSVNIGLAAVQPTINTIVSGNTLYKDGLGGSEPTPAKIKIKGSVFDGSDYYGTGQTAWNTYDVEGSSYTFLDGTGYDTEHDENHATVYPYMNISGGLYGCGTHCESGKTGREIIVRNYGKRSTTTGDEMTNATRTLTTIQRGGIVLLDNANVKLSGAPDISERFPNRMFGVLQVDNGLYIANASGVVLGSELQPAHMDSIKEVRSLHLISLSGTGTSYTQDPPANNPDTDANWEWIGINGNDNTLYHTRGTSAGTALTANEENVILFMGDSRMRVRYKEASTDKVKYGALTGFFRMRADNFQPEGMESFAYARPKLTDKVNPLPLPDGTGNYENQNQGDGGFLSYNNLYNNFTNDGTHVLNYTYTTTGDDGGNENTKTKQYPYYNFSQVAKNGNRADLEEYREWVLPKLDGHMWYVDGTLGWGRDETHADGWGDYPDKPKRTLTGLDGSVGIGLCNDVTNNLSGYHFSPAKDIIFVVGAIKASLEQEFLNLSMQETNDADHHQLRLFRYPGGHKLSNNETDAGGGYPASPNEGVGTGVTAGPGVNLGAMVNANKTSGEFVMENVLIDGLYEYTSAEKTEYQIPDSYAAAKSDVSEPLVVTAPGANLTLKGNKTTSGTDVLTNGTILQRGYNNTDASGTYGEQKNYYLNPDFKLTSVHNGGAMFVDSTAKVKVEGLLSIEGNEQKNGSGKITSNVYLHTFDTKLSISNTLDQDNTLIGITNPIRNRAATYADNTLSPVAQGIRAGKSILGENEINNGAIDANSAWEHRNFTDDLGWFFVNGHNPDNLITRTTYYNPTSNESTLYLGWTWANVVREVPAGYTDDGTNVTISSREGLAWFTKQVNGLFGGTPSNFSGKTVKQTQDLDMVQYVWVPAGGNTSGPFSSIYDGQGHLIKNLSIAYTSTGDRRYGYSNYGLFGNLASGTINRTFVVSGIVEKLAGDVNIGGLAARVTGTNSLISNSEAAMEIHVPDQVSSSTDIASGGLVGRLEGGEIHSSMAMPSINANNYTSVGGLVGYTGSSAQLNNSFAHPQFKVSETTSTVYVGGLVGNNSGSMKNNYIRLQSGNTHLTSSRYGELTYNNSGTVSNCYGYKEDKYTDDVYPLTVSGSTTNCEYFSPVSSTDTYGYMYMDNMLYSKSGDVWTKDTCMFLKLNRNIVSVLGDNVVTHKYARWARPTLSGINDDYPVLMLDNYDGSSNIGLGNFSSVANIAGSHAMQYGGTVRDGNQVNTALSRPETSTDNYMFIYGDVTEDISTTITVDAVAIYEDAAILQPGSLASFDNTYVGVSFDNTSRNATDAYGNRLYRDWHMFSSPLANAPLGMNYYNSSDNKDENLEGQWVAPGDGGNLYVYYPSSWAAPFLDDNLPIYGFTSASTSDGDGYFPSAIPTGYTKPTGERYAYPYDFYTWYEPDWQWINFKRNGPSHWHYDEKPGTTEHHHIDYKAHVSATANQNETTLVPGKGYMMAIDDNTYLQSHGHLNTGAVSFTLTNTSTNTSHWNWTWVPAAEGYFGNNFVGNPYHAYLNFDEFASVPGNPNSYYIYDADASATLNINYLIYTQGGSTGGKYGPKYLHPHQGFFLQTEDPIKDITFQSSSSYIVNRSDAGNSPFRDWRPAYPLVNLFAYDSEGRGDVVVIEFNRPENGGGKKVKTLRSGNHLIYAHNEDTDYGAFFAVEGTSRVPVRFRSYETENKPYTLRWDTHNGFFNSLYLIDNLLGITYDMLANDSYTFVGSKEDYVSRFVIVFNVTDVEENNDTNLKTFAFNDGNSWVVNGTGRLEVVDVTGRILYTEDLHNEQNHVNLNRYAKGVYLLRLWNSDKARIQKIVLH